MDSMKKVNVYPMTNGNGRAIPNQYHIKTEDATFFQSYKSIIVRIPHDPRQKTQLDVNYWDYSNTTSKYRNNFLGLTTKEIKAKIKTGEYELVDLNNHASKIIDELTLTIGYK